MFGLDSWSWGWPPPPWQKSTIALLPLDGQAEDCEQPPLRRNMQQQKTEWRSGTIGKASAANSLNYFEDSNFSSVWKQSTI